MNQQITVGMRVAFDSEHGPQIGWVTGLMPCIGNGQQHARIQTDGDPHGAVFTLPADVLTAAPGAPLTTDDYRNLRQMLGVTSDPKTKRGDGNYFHPATSDQKASMLRLVEHHMVMQEGSIHTHIFYTATAIGCAAVGLSRSSTRRMVECF